MMASAPRPVCIDPSDTKSEVDRDAGWLAFNAKVAAVVMTTARSAAQSLRLLTSSATVTFGEFQACNAHNAKKPAPNAMKCPTMML